MKQSMAASIIGCSDDLLSVILIHLPVKTLLRFKLVSKQWKFLISDPHFAVNHFRKNSDLSSPSGLFLYHPSRRTETLSVPFLRNPAGSVPPPLSPLLDQLLPADFANSQRVFQSCKGLLLCVFFNNCTYRVNAKSLCVICNPTTRDFRVLPTPPHSETNDKWFDGLTLVFNPSESHHYKVVCIKRSCEMQGGISELYIYSSETNRWKFHRSINPIEPYLQFPRGVFSNGAVFWIGLKHTYSYNVKSNGDVGVFEAPVSVPVDFIPSIRYLHTHYFSESCGRVFYAIAANICCPIYYIFELDSSVGMKWSNCGLNSSQHFGDYTPGHRTSVMAVSRSSSRVREEEDVNWDLVFSLTDRLIIVNSAMGSRHVQICDVKNMCEYLSCQYVPSLVPV